MKKPMKIVIYIIAPLLCIALGVSGTLFTLGFFNSNQPEKKIEKKKVIDTEYVYDWLLKNGEIVDGTKLKYTINKDNKAELIVNAYSSDSVRFWYTTKDFKNYTIDIVSDQFDKKFAINKLDIYITNTKDEDVKFIGNINLDNEVFAKNTPLDSWKLYSDNDKVYPEMPDWVIEDDGTVWVDGRRTDPRYPRYKDSNGTVYTFAAYPNQRPGCNCCLDIVDFRMKHSGYDYAKLKEIVEGHYKDLENYEAFAKKIAKEEKKFDGEYIRNLTFEFIDFLRDDLCPRMGITLADLGYKSYK